MRDTAFLAMMAWDATAMQKGKVTRAMLSDGKTEVHFSEQLKADILKAIEARKPAPMLRSESPAA